MNTYGYVGGNPVLYYDPTGKVAHLIVGLALVVECINDCTQDTNWAKPLCDAAGIDQPTFCAAKCTLNALNPLKYLKLLKAGKSGREKIKKAKQKRAKREERDRRNAERQRNGQNQNNNDED